MVESKARIDLDANMLEEILRRVDAKELQADDYATIHALTDANGEPHSANP